MVAMYGISEIILNYSPKNSKGNYDQRTIRNNYNSSIESNEIKDAHRNDDYIGYKLDTLCDRRSRELGDDKIFMNDDPEDYSGAFIDCETYFDILKQYETLYVISRESFNDTRMIRNSSGEYEEEHFSYYLFTVSDIDIANARGIRLRE